MTERFVQHAAHLVAIERRTGKTIALAIEPEPSCFLETTEEAVAFFRDHLFAPAAAGRLAELTGLSAEEAGRALRKHLGLCLDLCHAAVEFEDPAATVASLREAGVAVTKLQVSAGLRLAGVGAEARALLAPFDDGVYLHQVVEKRGSALTRYDDLIDAFEALGDAPAAADREWRLFLADLGPFSSTQAFVTEALALHAREPISPHLEVETYTWGVLPDSYRTGALPPAIARELQWVRQQLPA